MVEHRPERVVRIGVLRGHLDRLGDRDPERAGGVLALRAAGLRDLARRTVNRRPPDLHHRAAIGLLVVARPDHPDLAFEIEEATSERQRRAPLPSPRLSGQLVDPSLGVLIRLRDRGVGLVRTCRRAALVLVVDVRRRIEGPLQSMRTEERRRAPQLVDVAHPVGDLDLRFGRDLLQNQSHRKDRRQVVRSRRLQGARVQRWRRPTREIRHQVDPVGWDVLFAKQELDARLAHSNLSLAGGRVRCSLTATGGSGCPVKRGG